MKFYHLHDIKIAGKKKTFIFPWVICVKTIGVHDSLPSICVFNKAKCDED